MTDIQGADAVSITLADGRSFNFPLGPAVDEPACFVLGVRKSGSSILNAIAKALTVEAKRTFIDFPDFFFRNNVISKNWRSDPGLPGLFMRGYVYGGFRDMPLALNGTEVFTQARKILMVRDPRDALVSEYFSNAYSHRVPDETGSAEVRAQMLKLRADALAQPIGDFTTSRAKVMARTLMEFASVARDPNTLVLRYEDTILQKRDLIRRITGHFGWPCSPQAVDRILGWADVVPGEEDPERFVRKVVPGDHKDKLDAPTIASLNATMAEPMALFGYQ